MRVVLGAAELVDVYVKVPDLYECWGTVGVECVDGNV